MARAVFHAGKNYAQHLHSLEREWERLCSIYLPFVPEHSPWRYSRSVYPDDPKQGWKLHVSTTILSATKILRKIAPWLQDQQVLFKAPRSLLELKKINTGLFYGFSQVGKCITIYPQSPEEALDIAQQVHKWTYRYPGPAVPYDVPYRHNSRVSYRYGAFGSLTLEQPDGQHVSAIQTPDGELIADLREPGKAAPLWVQNPFPGQTNKDSNPSVSQSFFQKGILPYEALSQRGKGGVYLALDLTMSPPYLRILKEGRKNGETELDGRDGYWRVEHEAFVLETLRSAQIEVPRVFAQFQLGTCYYVVMEYIEGQTLQTMLNMRQGGLPIAEVITYGKQIARLLHQIHTAGWAWRDCKPLNLLVSMDGVLRPLDFEGACPVNDPDPMPWGTPGYCPPEWLEGKTEASRIAEDLYAYGVTLHQLISGIAPTPKQPLLPIDMLNPHIPDKLRQIINILLAPSPQARLDAQTVLDMLSFG